ncbi:TetR/AcrR family transcriptional regulator [Streptomyces sp. NPDC001796]|uniref:TetR/AcrR family transcriptional regulator n=1 Tax=Streptomyces sp. NPDC001796 TaxID=3364609 RepID=UPI0036C2FFC1
MRPVDPARGDETRPVLTRRERQRRATVDEIVDVGRSLLREGREVTLRAVAADMGFTPPALYRYVDSAAALSELLSNDIFVEVVGEMEAAGAPYGDDDPAAQMVAAATAFRSWALDNKAEFQLVFATTSLTGERTAGSAAGRPRHPLARGGAEGATSGVEMFANFFGGIFTRLLRQRPFPVPGPEELDEEFVAVHAQPGDGGTDITALLGKDALGMIWLFELSWAQLYGIITLEVFGHIRPRLIKSGALFRAVMRDIGSRAGMAEDWDRLSTVSQEVLDRRTRGRAAVAN